MNVYSYGQDALLIELDSAAAASALRARLDTDPSFDAVETMPGLRTVLVRFDPHCASATGLARRLADLSPTPSAGPDADAPTGPEADAATDPVLVPVSYDGPDLDNVADCIGLTADTIVELHQAALYRVALIGMAPGFYFLSGGDPRLCPPRRTTPRQKVPRGALGLAGPYTGIYPRHGPGGWQLIGQVLDDLWHSTRLPAAKLAPETAVRFVAA